MASRRDAGDIDILLDLNGYTSGQFSFMSFMVIVMVKPRLLHRFAE